MVLMPVAARRIPCLDGLRAISIAAVLVLHISGTKNFLSTATVDPFAPGDLGVRTFFVISGFLITTLLLKELGATGSVSLKNFYIRRILRIFPAFYFYVAVLAILSATGTIVLGRHDLLIASTYTVNYHVFGISWYISHFWSLAVEEQFYFLWPATLFFIGHRAGMKVAIGVMLIAPLIRLGIWYFVPDYGPYMFKSFETSCDALAAGCLLAGTRDWLGSQGWYQRYFLQSKFVYLVPFLIILCSMSVERPRIHLLIGVPLENILIALLIDWLVRFPNSLAGRILETRSFVHAGTLSYSLYLWQQPFCTQWRFPDTWWGSFPVNLMLGVTAAHGSFYLIEKPFLSLKTKLEKRKRVQQALSA
jgi:peptidoglycan/LPS O-acetylase OafA/YrhL